MSNLTRIGISFLMGMFGMDLYTNGMPLAAGASFCIWAIILFMTAPDMGEGE